MSQPDAERSRSDTRQWLAGLAILLVVVMLFWMLRIVFSGTEHAQTSSDVFLLYYPTYAFQYGQLAAGVLPGWNPHQITGLPSVGTLQGGFYYPPHLLYLLLPDYLALASLGLLHLAFAAGSMLLLARRIGLAPIAAVAAALVLALRGRYPWMMLFPPMLETSSWLPMGAVAVLALARGGGARSIAFFAFCVGMSLLAGFPQNTVYILYAWSLLLVVFLVHERAPLPQWLRALGSMAAALLLGFSLAAVQLLPAMSLSAEGTRAMDGMSVAQMMGVATHIRDVGRGFEIATGVSFPGLPIGLGGVVLSLLPLCLLGRRHRTLALGALLTASGVVLFAMGPVTPVFEWLRHLPGLGWFRLPNRSVFIADFCVALSVGIAVHTLFALWGRGRAVDRERSAGLDGGRASTRRMLAIGLSLAGGVSIAFLPSVAETPMSTVFGCACAAAVALVVVSARWTERTAVRPAMAPMLVVFVLLLLVLEPFLAPPNRDRLIQFDPKLRAPYELERQVYARLRRSSERVWIRNTGFFPKIPPKAGSLFGFRSITDYEPVNLRRQSEYFTFLKEGRPQPMKVGQPYDGRLYHLTAPLLPGALEQRGHLLDLASVRYFLFHPSDLRQPELARYIRRRGLERIFTSDPAVVLLENPHALPRAFIAYATAVAPPAAELLVRLSDPAFDPRLLSYVEGASPIPEIAAPPGRGEAPEILVDDPGRVEIDANLLAPGLLVLGDSFARGWVARLDDEPLEILPTNHLYRGVALPAGRHRVTFEYVPWEPKAGAASSLLAALVIGVLASRR